MNSVKNRWLLPRSEPWELLQRAMNSAISAMVYLDFLNKKKVFGAKPPAIIQKLSQHIEQKKSLSGEGAGNRLLSGNMVDRLCSRP